MAKKEDFLLDVRFIISERKRIASLVQTGGIRLISQDDAHYSFGGMLCGKAAAEKFDALIVEVAQRAKLIFQIQLSTIQVPLERLIVSRFIKEGRSVDIAQLDRVFSSAIKEARSKLESITHFVPCHLMAAHDPEQIVLGPVIFHNRSSFRSLLLQKSRERECDDDRDLEESHRRLLALAIRYYRNFQWVAEVTIPACDEKTSSEVASNAVTAALDFLHLSLGFRHTDRMQVGGMGLSVDRRARITISEAGILEPSVSRAGFGHVEYRDGWSSALDNEEFRSWLELCGVALEATVDPGLERPLSRRLLDAVQWFGEACRETSASTRTIKFMTALERLLSTGECNDISTMLSERAASLCLSSQAGQKELREKTRQAYDYRSRLVHGSMSPRDSEARKGAYIAAEVSQEVIRRALSRFGADGLRASSMSERRLATWFNKMKV